MTDAQNLPHTQRLLEIMAKLRDPETGCPWDVEQTNETILPYTIEEVYEVAEAIHTNDTPALKEELGDLLLQIVFYAQMAQEKGDFTFEEIAQNIADKMIHRHPHVFGEADIKTAAAQTEAWETLKAKELAEKENNDTRSSVLDNIPLAFPALMRAQKISKRAARTGFDWDDVHGVYNKISEEFAEVKEAIAENDHAHIEEEIGDLLFSIVNLARHVKVDAETALAAANRKFEHRFRHIEQRTIAQGKTLEASSLEEMEALWKEAKHAEE